MYMHLHVYLLLNKNAKTVTRNMVWKAALTLKILFILVF